MLSKGEETRKRIVDTALQLFSVKEFYGTSVQNERLP